MTEDDWRKEWIPRISVRYTSKFIRLTSSSGYSLQFTDPEVDKVLLQPDADDATLGQAILNTLKQSRFLPYDVAAPLSMKTRENYPLWINKLMQQYGYKNKTALFKNMKSCSIEGIGSTMKIISMRHESREGWGRENMPRDYSDAIYIAKDSPVEEIGAALRLGFTRCKERHEK